MQVKYETLGDYINFMQKLEAANFPWSTTEIDLQPYHPDEVVMCANICIKEKGYCVKPFSAFLKTATNCEIWYELRCDECGDTFDSNLWEDDYCNDCIEESKKEDLAQLRSGPP